MASDTSATDDTMLGQGPGGGGGAPAPHPRVTSTAAGDLPAGTLVGEYQVDTVIGRGGMGTVYSARHPVIGKRVAIKVLSAALSSEPDLVRRFADEARAVNKIAHPNIIDIFSFGQLADGRQYFAMEFLEGQTLAERLAGGGLENAELQRFVTQACEALDAAHREKIVHRDLKPENVWVAAPKHGAAYVKLLDFGIAKLQENANTDNVTQTGVAMGTPQFMSPEQCVGRDVDHRTDIYALGVILYLAFTGRYPFEGKSFAEVVAAQITAKPVPPSKYAKLASAVERLILACLEKDPARRPQSAGEVAKRLAQALADVPNQLTRAGVAGEPALGVMPSRGRRVLSIAIAAAVLVGVGIAVALFTGGAPQQATSPVVPSAAPAAVAPVVAAPPAAPAAAVIPAPAVEPATAPAATAPRARVRAAVAPAETPPVGEPRSKTRVEKKGLVTDNPFE